jgi:septal ring factor EnvC (AmiA/AmiB activator)
MLMRKLFFILIAIVFCVFLVSQEKKEDLTSKRKKILDEIEYTSKLLDATTQKKGSNIEKVKLIDKRISQRSDLIGSYQQESEMIDLQIADKENRVHDLENELKVQKKLYAGFIRYNFKNSDNFSTALLLLASDNINQLYLRNKYINQINEARRSKILLIKRIKSTINNELSDLVAGKKKKDKVVQSLKRERNLLSTEKSNRERNIKDLGNEEKRLRQQIEDKKKIEKEIADKLEELIREETKKGTSVKMTPEQKLVSSDFEKNKGKLPWPTRQGVITEKYGQHQHPVIKDLTVDNPGIDITTSTDEIARSVFTGEVCKVFAVKGGNYAVIIKHGTYYTVYSNLFDVKVNVGDKIKTKDILGKVAKSKNNNASVLLFEMYRGTERLNPEEWISN